MDALSEVLNAVKMEGAVFYNAEFTAPWGFRSPQSCNIASFLGKGTKHIIIYHLVTEGRATAKTDDDTCRIPLIPGDIVVFPHGDAHTIFNGSPMEMIGGSEGQMKRVFGRGMKLARAGGGGEPTRFVCGYMECDRELSKGFLGGLPPLFKVNIRNDDAGKWLEGSIKFSAEQAAEERAGGDAVLAKLSEALFVETLRRYMMELPGEQTGWLAGARDPLVGQALAFLHREPARSWTIAEVAKEVGASRSVLAERFRHFLGEPPMTYLMRWRLQLGAQMLHSTSYSVAQIADEVGYESEPAFNRAFKREYGMPPARFRVQTKKAKRASAASVQ
ncbi:MAG TPA: AraC family transcriptional regulator [Terriglobales bacterium]|nr:AraC family transcriptional regulator [Terriglobales bacterium]